jgi:hypothetical protein
MDATQIEAAVEDGIVKVGDKNYLTDAKGSLVPVELVKPQHRLEDETVRKIIGFARELSAQIARFRGHTMTDLGEFDALLEQEYGGRPRGGVKGNRTYQSFDGLLKVQVQVADMVDFGPELQIAKGLIDECLNEWAAMIEAVTANRPGCGNRLGTRWRGRLPIPPHAHPLVRRLFEEMNRQRTTITEVAERAGFRRETISEWRYSYQPRIADLDAAYNVLGLELSVRHRRDEP